MAGISKVEPATFFFFASGFRPPPDSERFWIPMIDLLFKMTEAFAASFAAGAYFAEDDVGKANSFVIKAALGLEAPSLQYPVPRSPILKT